MTEDEGNSILLKTCAFSRSCCSSGCHLEGEQNTAWHQESEREVEVCFRISIAFYLFMPLPMSFLGFGILSLRQQSNVTTAFLPWFASVCVVEAILTFIAVMFVIQHPLMTNLARHCALACRLTDCQANHADERVGLECLLLWIASGIGMRWRGHSVVVNLHLCLGCSTNRGHRERCQIKQSALSPDAATSRSCGCGAGLEKSPLGIWG